MATEGALLNANKSYSKGLYEKTLSKISTAEYYGKDAPEETKRKITLLKARTYEAMGDLSSSVAIYEYILKNFPDSQEGYIAKKKLAN